MPCIECIALHAAHLAWAWIYILKNGDKLDRDLISILTIYSLIGYLIVGALNNPVLGFAVIQLMMGATCLAFSQRLSGNVSGLIFSVLSIIGGLAVAGLLPSNLWQGVSYNYWNISAIGLHMAIAIAWVKSNGHNSYNWIPGS